MAWWGFLIIYGSVMVLLIFVGAMIYAFADGNLDRRNGSRTVYAGFVWPLLVPWVLFVALRGAWRAAEFDVPKVPKKKRDKHPTDW